MREWGKKQVIVVQKDFFETLPTLPQVELNRAELAWHLYDLQRQDEEHFNLILSDVIYAKYQPTINRISTPEVGKLENFIEVLQQKLDDKLSRTGKINCPKNA